MFAGKKNMLYQSPRMQDYQVNGIRHIAASDINGWLVPDGILIDIREFSEHTEGVPTLSIQCMKTPLSSFIHFLDHLPKDKKVVVMCAHGIRSAQLTQWLNLNGWPDAVNLDGGFAAYRMQNLDYQIP